MADGDRYQWLKTLPKLNIAALTPHILAALRPGANLAEFAKSMGIEVEEVIAGSVAHRDAVVDVVNGSNMVDSLTLSITGRLTLLNGKKVRILAVLGDFPEGAEAPGQPLSLSD
jgi:hypothetical protein